MEVKARGSDLLKRDDILMEGSLWMVELRVDTYLLDVDYGGLFLIELLKLISVDAFTVSVVSKFQSGIVLGMILYR